MYSFEECESCLIISHKSFVFICQYTSLHWRMKIQWMFKSHSVCFICTLSPFFSFFIREQTLNFHCLNLGFFFSCVIFKISIKNRWLLGVIQCEIVHRVHWSKSKLACIYHDTDSKCDKCHLGPADLTHMFWTCSALSVFWTSLWFTFRQSHLLTSTRPP